MTLPSSANLMESPEKLAHKSKNYRKPTGMSFAFLFSIVVYTSIFYIFSPSPSALFSNPKFWFAISNTLILIIAADYGAFASSKDQKPEVYEEYYALHSQARRSSAASFASQYPETEKKSILKEEESSEEKKKEDEADQKNNEIPERILEVVKVEPKTDELQEVDDKKMTEPKTIRRSQSDKVKPVTFNDKKNNLQRSKTEKHEPVIAKENLFPEEENEFSTMSDEELNRRVEEFIQKFNEQIRLQGA